MLAIKNLEVSIGTVTILRDVSIDLPNQTFLGIVGRNGAGKTTLLKTIIGLLAARGGFIKLDEVYLDSTVPAFARAQMGIGYMPEDRRLFHDLTVEDNILLPSWVRKEIDGSQKLASIYETIPEIKELSTRKARYLSGGQQKLVSLGRALMCGNRILLLDEPFEGVAPALAQRLAKLILNLREKGLSILLTESDLSYSRDILDNVYLIDRGKTNLIDIKRS